MKHSIDLSSWRFDPNFPDSERSMVVRIHFVYPDIKPLLHLSPPERKAAIDVHHQQKFEQLIATALFDNYKVIGDKKRPRGITTTIPLLKLSQICNLEVVDHIYPQQIDHAVQKKPRPVSQFYCVKMTVACIIEGQESGMQTIEERFVMIKAHSFDEAYKKVEDRKEDYELQYLNTDGALVSWVIESYDDCYQTDIFSAKDLNEPNMAEVYSKYRSRRYRKPNS